MSLDPTAGVAYKIRGGMQKGIGLLFPNTSWTSVPIDFSEWYFIVATYNPDIDEPSPTFSDMSVVDTDNSIDPDFWNGNIKLDGNYTHSSGYGNRCKVEFISRTDLLRARGYKE